MMILTINKGMKERTNFNAVRLVPDSDRVQQAMKLKDLKYVVPMLWPLTLNARQHLRNLKPAI